LELQLPLKAVQKAMERMVGYRELTKLQHGWCELATAEVEQDDTPDRTREEIIAHNERLEWEWRDILAHKRSQACSIEKHYKSTKHIHDQFAANLEELHYLDEPDYKPDSVGSEPWWMTDDEENAA